MTRQKKTLFLTEEGKEKQYSGESWVLFIQWQHVLNTQCHICREHRQWIFISIIKIKIVFIQNKEKILKMEFIIKQPFPKAYIIYIHYVYAHC